MTITLVLIDDNIKVMMLIGLGFWLSAEIRKWVPVICGTPEGLRGPPGPPGPPGPQGISG